MIESTFKLEFGKVSFLDNILIAELNEGILFDIPHNRELLKINDKKYQININVTNKIDNLNINFKGNDTNSNILEYKNKIASKIYI